jgi:drug/metabolite transporter (DMT)-like permease
MAAVAPAPPSGRREYLADASLVLVTLVWGSTFVVVKEALVSIGPFEYVALRFGVAFLVLAALFQRRVRRLGAAGRQAGLVIGGFLFLGYALQTSGLPDTTAGRAAFITGLSVVLVPLFASRLLHQPVGPGLRLALVLAPLGLWLLSFDGEMSLHLGDLLVFGGAVAFAGHIVAISAYVPQYDPLALAVVQVGVVAVLAAGTALVLEHPLPAPTTGVALSAGYTGVVGSALVLGVQTSVQRFTSASHTALIFTLEPVFAAAFAYVLAGETLGPRGWLGGALILGAMLVAELKRS